MTALWHPRAVLSVFAADTRKPASSRILNRIFSLAPSDKVNEVFTVHRVTENMQPCILCHVSTMSFIRAVVHSRQSSDTLRVNLLELYRKVLKAGMLLKVQFSLYYVLHLWLLHPTSLDKRAFVSRSTLRGPSLSVSVCVCLCVCSVLQLTHGPAHERWWRRH